MEIVFDERKCRSNLEKHGYDFAELDMTFFDTAKTFPAKLDRLIAVGRWDDTIIAVVFRPLGSEALSVISMRHASHYERSLV